MFKIKEHEIKRCSISEFNAIINKESNSIFINEQAEGKDIKAKVYLWSNISKAYLVFNEFTGKNTVTKCYETDLNDRYEDGYLEKISSVNQHASACSRAFKFPRVVNDKSEAEVQASGIIWSNKKYNNKKTYCYEYDMHLAWLSTFMTCPLPDTSVEPRRRDIVKEGEIGFLTEGLYNYNCHDTVTFAGEYGDYIFPITYCPNIKYCEKLLAQINAAPDKLTRYNLKSRFNEWLGTMQNKNPFIRVAVIAQSNERIISLIKKYKDKLIFSVTDSLGAVERIPELDKMIGTQPGCWSIKNQGYLYSDGTNRLYIDNNGYITNSVIRGVPKEHVKGLTLESYKKLVIKVDPRKNLYKLDFENRRIIPNEERA